MKFDFLVADATGVGRSSRQIFRYEVIDHLSPEFPAHIQLVEGDIQTGGHSLGFLLAPDGKTVSDIEAADLVALPEEIRRGDGAIDAAAQTHENSLLSYTTHCFGLYFA
jgi:hypothetical protein